MTKEVITYDRLELDLPVSMNSIKEFRLEQQLNEHNRLSITGTLAFCTANSVSGDGLGIPKKAGISTWNIPSAGL